MGDREQRTNDRIPRKWTFEEETNKTSLRRNDQKRVLGGMFQNA